MRIVKNSEILMKKIQLLNSATGSIEPLQLWDKQIEALNMIHNHRFVIFLKSRQSGFSKFITGLDSLIQCLRIERFHVAVLTMTESDAIEYLKYQKLYYTSFQKECYDVPGLITPVKLKTGKYSNKITDPDSIGTQDEIEFENGSTFVALSAHRGRSFTKDRIIVDEAAWITANKAKIDLSYVLMAVDPTIDKSKGQLILVSTANGLNTYYELYQAARNGSSKYKCLFFSCWDDPNMTAEIRLEKSKTFLKDGKGESYTNQEYPRDDQEAFLSSGNPRFDKSALIYYKERPLPEIIKGSLIDDGSIVVSENGEFTIIKTRNQRSQYAICADVGEGLPDSDNSVAKVFDRETLDQVAEWCGKCEPSTLGDILCNLGRTYNNAILIIERNNHGLSTIDTVIKYNQYPDDLVFEFNSIKKEHIDDDFTNPSKRFGWLTTSTTRPLIINNLAKMIANRSILAFLYADVEELFRFMIINGKAQAEAGCYDDRVLCLAISYYLLTNDAFEVAYPYAYYQDYMSCFDCKKSNYKYGDKDSTCELTGRFVIEKDICSLWARYNS